LKEAVEQAEEADPIESPPANEAPKAPPASVEAELEELQPLTGPRASASDDIPPRQGDNRRLDLPSSMGVQDPVLSFPDPSALPLGAEASKPADAAAGGVGAVAKGAEAAKPAENAEQPNAEGAKPEEAAADAAKAPEEKAQAEAGKLVLLLVGDVKGSHEPQVFRMRIDMPLQRLLLTYAKFRSWASGAEGLWLSGLGRERLEPTVTAGEMGLTDGAELTVNGGPQGEGAEPAAKAAGEPAAAGRGRKRGAQQKPPAERRKQQRKQGPEPDDKQPKRPVSAYFLWCSESREAIAAALGSTRPQDVTRAAGERWKALSAEEKAPFEARSAELKAEYEKAMSEFVAQGGVPVKRHRKSKLNQQPPEPVKGKRPRGSTFALSQKGKTKKPALKAAESKPALKATDTKRWADVPEEAKKASREQAARRLKEDVPASPVRLMRSAVVTQGAAKGWKVSAWRTASDDLKWLIVEPQLDDCSFRTFNSFRGLRQAIKPEVFNQLNDVVRPGLLRRLDERASTGAAASSTALAPPPLPDVETPLKKRPGEEDAQTRQKKPRADSETPRRPDKPVLATQVCPPPRVGRPKSEAWTCRCLAHLTRHSRCASSASAAKVHIEKTAVTFGRAETCDVVLASVRTPQMLSRCHASLRCEGNKFTLIDQGSVNGCLVNDRVVKGSCELAHGDIVTFGVQTETPEFDYVFETRAGNCSISS